jgi:hypothetical protein
MRLRQRGPSPSRGRRAAKQVSPGRTNLGTDLSRRAAAGQEGPIFVTFVRCVIGSACIVFDTETYTAHPDGWRLVTVGRWQGPVRGTIRDERRTVHRYQNPVEASDAYHARRHALGIDGITPFVFWKGGSNTMGGVFLTRKGQQSTWARQAAEQMQAHGVHVAFEPAAEDVFTGQSFWAADDDPD